MTGFTIGIREAIYITQIKDLFKQTNIKKFIKDRFLITILKSLAR